MPNQLFMEERRRAILDELKQNGRVFVNELSERLNVSTVTIRQDLNVLETEGLLSRTHGGAMLVDEKTAADEPELSFDIRRGKQFEEKDAIGQAAAQLVEDGSAIALDASTTVCSILPYLKHLDSLTVVTNNLMVAEMLVKNPRINVLLAGGRLRRDSYSVVGNPETLPDINLQIGFFSAWGVALQAGLTEVNQEEKLMKQALLARCMKKIVLVDSTKWGRIAPYTYANPQDVDLIMTTEQAPTTLHSQFKGAKIQMLPLPKGT